MDMGRGAVKCRANLHGQGGKRDRNWQKCAYILLDDPLLEKVNQTFEKVPAIVIWSFFLYLT